MFEDGFSPRFEDAMSKPTTGFGEIYLLTCTVLSIFAFLTGTAGIALQDGGGAQQVLVQHDRPLWVLAEVVRPLHGGLATVIAVSFVTVSMAIFMTLWRKTSSQLKNHDASWRSQQLRDRWVSAALYVVLPVGLIMLSGLGLTYMQGQRGELPLFSQRTRLDLWSSSTMYRVHVGIFMGPLVKVLWFVTGLVTSLLAVLWARMRGARLTEEGRSAMGRAFEDVSQGTAVGTSLGILLVLLFAQWGDIPPIALRTLCVLVAAIVASMHTFMPIATSGGWRFFTLALAAGVALTDVFQAGGPDVALWGTAAGFGLFGVFAARVGRREAEPSTTLAD